MTCLQQICKLSIRACVRNISRKFSTELVSVTNSKSCHLPILATTLVNKNPWIWQQNINIQTPISSIISTELPLNFIIPLTVPLPERKSEIEAPGTEISKYEKETARLIVIRRHKMRKHKLKKLRKKMKFEWAKRRQRREMKKEKAFQAVLLAQIKEAENFSAEEYVATKIEKATEVPIPRYWKGKRLPEFIIREKLGLPPK